MLNYLLKYTTSNSFKKNMTELKKEIKNYIIK